MKIKMGNKWRNLNVVKCRDCDYLCCFEGTDEWFCSNNNREKVGMRDTTVKDTGKFHTCKWYFPAKKE